MHSGISTSRPTLSLLAILCTLVVLNFLYGSKNTTLVTPSTPGSNSPQIMLKGNNQSLDSLPNLGQKELIKDKLLQLEQLQRSMELATDAEKETYAKSIKAQRDEFIKAVKLTKGLDTTTTQAVARMMPAVTPCPEMQVIELLGIPGFAETNELVICGAPDTLAFLMFIEEPGNISGTQMTATFLPGMQYAGFELTRYGTTTISNLDPTPSNPKFLLEGITEGVYIGYIGVEATCDANINAFDYSVGLDFNFIYEDTLGNFQRCRQSVTPIRAYNSVIKEPVINFRSTANTTVTSLATETCTTVQISQDGIDAYLTEIDFSICNVDFANELSLTSISANGTPVPYTYNAADSTVTMTIGGSFFQNNSRPNPADTLFDESEFLNIQICMQIDECPNINTQIVTYKASYDCYGEVCQIIQQQREIRVRPTDRPEPIATSELVQQPGVCGTPAVMELNLTSSIADSAAGIFTDLTFGYETCQSSSLDISQVTIGGMPLPATAYSWNNGDILIDLTTLATDPDGPGGIQDADFDGFYDDLPGGEAVVVRIELDFQCNLPPDPGSIDCASIDCSFGQFFITAKRDCGQAFTFEPPVSDFSIRNGATYVELKNQDQINTSTIGYNFGTTRTSGATCSPLPVRVKTVEFCYIYETENVAPCDPANTTNELQVVFDGTPRLVYDVEFVAGSGEMTVNGVTTQTGATGTFTNLSASSRLLSLPIGELNEGDEVCYIYQLAADSASCSPAIYMNGVHQVIETCTNGGCTCKTVKACDIALFRSDPSNCGCTCDIASGGTTRRWNLGYTDEKMTEKIALEDVPAADLNRYLPCDTMLYEGYMTFNSPESVGELYQWYFVANITNIGNNGWAGNDDTELMIDSKGTKLLGLDFSSGDGSGRVPIDVSSLSECLDQPGPGATGFFAYAGETPWSDVTYNIPMPNSSYEYHDGNLFGVYFRNFNKLEDCRNREYSWEEVNCLDQLKDTYGIGVGDTIYMRWLLPLTKNVKAFANKTADPSFTFKDPQIINVASGHFLDEFDSDCLVGLSNCRTNSPFTTFCPEDLNAVTEIKLDDCGGSVEHKFNVVKPTPVNWYTAEYRPFFKMEDIEVPMYSPLIYCGNAKLVTKCGVEYPLDVQSMTNHDCATVNGQEYCTVSSGTEGAITFNPETDGYPGLGVGLGGYVDDFKIVYDLCKVCPAESPDLSDYEITYDYRICEPVNGICFRCNQAANGTSNELPMVCGNIVNRFASYYDVLNMDTLYRWDDVTSGDVIKTDTSKGFPTLTQTQDQNLLASASPGTSEELNTFMVCADGSDLSLPTHMGVLSSVTLTNSVELVGAYDASGNPLVFDTVSTSATSNTFAVFLPDLAPGDCMTFTLGTRLLFCPVPPDVPEICVTTTSGCMDRDVMAALAGITSNCNSIETCYEYIFEEAAIQADFLLPNAGDTYALCDTIPLAVLVKNVKGTTVKDLILDIDLPLTGMQIIPGSFEASYPNSGNFALPFYSIVDPAINGNNLLYSEDNDFSNAIHSNGLPGITSAGDSNFVVVRFNVETICDEFVSGSQASFEATAKDPCSPATISTGLVTSNSIIINGGNPADFGQILITAKPSEAFCGQETPTFKITGQNISEKPLGDSVIMCVTLPAGINYQAGSMRYVIPTNLNVGVESVTTVNGQTQICFQGYENMPVGGAFTLNFEADFDVAAMCGDYDIQVDTKNLIEDQSCTDGGECDVFVQSSVNPNFTMTLKGPLETVDLKLFRQCDGNDDPVTICYEVVLRNPGPDYNGDVLVNLHDDLQANQTLDFYDPILGTGSHTGISVASGDSITLTGCYTVDEINSCPVILDMVYDSPCACNHLATPYATIEPEFTAVLPPTTVLCPGQELGLELCGDFDIAYDPASNIVTRMVGDSLYLSVVDQSIVTRIDFTGTAGECSVDETRFIRGVEDFDLDIADSLTCQNQDFILEPTIPIEYQDFITVQWTPATNLDDATLINPLFSSAIPGLYGYKIELEFNGGCILTDSVTVEVKPVGMINITGNNTICYPFETNTLTATAGYDYYEWYLLDGGFEIIQASTVPEMWTGPTEPGKYIVKGFRSTDMCPSASDTIMIMQADCVDLELEKTICEIDAVPNFGDTISYQIDVCNRRDTDSLLIHDAEMVQVTDMLPAGVMFVSYTSTQGTYTPGGGGLWDIGTIASGACHTLKIKAKLVDYGKQINTAEISNSSKEDIDSEENNDDGDQSEDDEDMAMFTLETFDLALTKVICPSTMVPIVNLGDTILYCITVENQGQVDAYNVSVVDHPAPEINPIDPNWVDSTTFWAYHSIDSIPAGQSVTIMLRTEIIGVPADSFANNFSEILMAEDAEGDHPTDIDSTPDSDETNDGPFEDNLTDNTNGDEDDHDPARLYVRIVDMALKKTTAVTQPVKAGQDIPYTITLYNQGNIATTNIKVTEYIPPGLDLNAGLSSGWMDMDSVAMFLITDTVSVGDSIQVPITMTVLPNSTNPIDLINVAEISSFQDTLGMDVTNNDMDSDGDTDPNNDGVPNPGDPDDNNIYGDAEKGEDEDDSDPEGLTVFDLALKKTTADPGPFSFDDVVTFDFTVYNQGNVPAKNIEIMEVTPCGYMVAPSSAPLWSTTGNTSETTITNTIQPGDSFVVSIDLIIQPCDQPDAYKNTGEISASQDEDGNDTTDSDIDSDADGDPSNDGSMEDNATDGENGDEDDSDFEIIEVFDLALVKTILTPGPYQYGDVIEFEITVHNQGNVPAANITVSDSIPAGYSFSTGNNTGWSGSALIVDYTFAGPILPLDSAKTTIKLTLENTGGGASNYTNIAEITMAEDTTGMVAHDGDSTPDSNFGNDEGGEPEGPTDNQTNGDGTDDEDDHDPAIIHIFDLALNKTTMDVGPFKYGDVVTFDFTVYNQGNITANNIEITELTPCGFMVAPSNSPLWSTVGDTSTTTITSAIMPGDSSVVSIDLIVQPCGNPAGWKNTGEISGSEDDMGNDTSDDDIDSHPDGDPSNDGDMEDDATDNENGDEDDSDFEEIAVFDLAQIKEIVSAGPFEYGDTIHYLITVINQGNVTADEIYVFDHIPPGLLFDATLNLDWTPSGTMVNTLIEDPILPGLTSQVELYLVLNQTIPGHPDDFTNISEIQSSEDGDGNDTSGSDADSDPDTNATDDMGGEPEGPTDNQTDGDGTDDEDDHDPAIIRIFDLALKKTTTEMGPFSYGQTIKFDYTVYNQGNVPAMNIKVNDYIPCGYMFAPSNTPTWSLVADTAMTTIGSTIQPGDSTMVSIEFIIEPCAEVGAWKNVGEIAASEDDEGNDTTDDDIDSDADSDPNNDGDMDDNTTNNDNEDEDDSDFEVIEIFDLAQKKVLLDAGPYAYGDTLTYEFTIYNQGNVPATNIAVTDHLPPGLVFFPSLNPGWTGTAPTVTNTITSTVLGKDSIKIQTKLILTQTIGNYDAYHNISEISSATDTMGVAGEDIDSTPDGNPTNDGPMEDNATDGENGDEDDSDFEIIQVFDLALKKIIDPTQVLPIDMIGETITYCIIVENQGTIDAHNISIADNPPSELTIIDPNWDDSTTYYAYNYINSLLVGEMDTIKLSATINAVPSDSFLVNYAEILDAEDGMGNHPNDIDSNADSDPTNDGDIEDDLTDNTNDDEDDHDPAMLHVRIVDLALKKQTTVTTPVQVGQDIPYTITVYNQGNVHATQIKVSEYIPVGLDFNAALSPAGWMDMDSIAMFTITDTLGFMDSMVLNLYMTVLPNNTSPADLINVAEISSFRDTMNFDITYNDQDSNGDTDPDNDDVPAPGDPDDDYVDGDGDEGEDEDDSDPEGLTVFDLALKKTTAATGPFTYGDLITFDIEVINQGNVPSTNIEVTDIIPCGYQYVQANNPLWSKTGNAATTVITDTLQGGDSKIVSIQLIIQPCMGVDGWRNTAEISESEDDEGNNTTDEDIDSDADDDPSDDGDMEDNATDNENGDEDDSDFEDIQIFDLALTKKVINPQSFYIPGDTVEYKIAVYNQGNTKAYDLQIGDYLPIGLVFSPAANTAASTGNPYDWVNNSLQVTTNIDSLSVSDSTCLTLKFLIDYSFRGNQIINYAEIGNAASDMGGPNETDADSDADTNNSDTGGGVETDEDDHIDDDGTDTNGDGITDEDDHDPAVIKVRTFSTRILNACNCLDNGYAQDEVTIYSPIVNDVWTITQNTGMLTSGLSSIPLNTNVAFVGIENGYYVYKVIVTHQSNVGYTGVFANGLTTLTVSNICVCPEIITTIDGIPPPIDSIPTITQTLSKTSIAENTLISCEGTSFSNYTVHSLYVDTAACRTAQTICPTNQWQRLKVTFNEFDLADGDALCVFEGKDTVRSLIARWSGTGVSQTGGWITANCDPDINPSGCLTFLFKTNGDNSKALGWRSTVTCEERDIVLKADDLQANLACDQTHQVFTIRPATVESECTGLKDSQLVRIYNSHEELCHYTCLAINRTFDLALAIGQYKVEYTLKSDSAKTTSATISVQETPIVCNDEVTIPMGSACSIAISPDDLLENPCDTITDTVYYFITLKGIDKNGQETVLASGGGKGGNYPVITKEMIDQCSSTIKATIEKRYYEGVDLDICNNGTQLFSCTVKVNIKDELPPVFGPLASNDTLVACNLALTQNGLGLTTPDAVDNCGTATVTFGGAQISTPSINVCDTTRAIISWIATDECGNTATATQQVVIIRPQLADIVKTDEVILTCDNDAAIDESATIPSIKTGRLKNGMLEATDTIALSTTEYICGYILQYTDTQIPAVDCGRKIFRNWTVLDWCDSQSGPQAIDTTFITFKDTLAPAFAKEAGANIVIDLDHQSCTYDVNELAKPVATDNCSTPSVRLAKVDRIENDTTWEILQSDWANLDADSFQLSWIAEDACHEQLINDTLTQIIVIRDVSKPSVNCTDNINLALGQDKASLHYTAIDAGSYDACGIAKYEISRDEMTWDSIVVFDCQDIHVANKVYLRVTDNQGNQNTCWMTVNIEDKVMPICSDLPTINTTCDEGHVGDGLPTTDSNDNEKMEEAEWVDMTPTQAAEFNSKYGQPNCSDNVACEELVIEQQYQFIKKACGIATIKRRYRAIDWQGEGNISNWAGQTINMESKAAWAITLPADWKGECEDDIPDSEITIVNGACDLLGFETEEKVFTTVDNACLKVIKTFTITNWCKYEAGGETVVIPRMENIHGFVEARNTITADKYENVGQFTYVQILKVQDNTAPVIIIEEVDNCIESDNCEATKRFAITATDCNEAATTALIYNWTISTNGRELATGKTSTFNYTVVPKVNYEVSWTVADNCGNTAWETVKYEFADCKKPAPYCIGGVSVQLMESGLLQVWTSDFERGSTDNCTSKDQLAHRIWHTSLGNAPSNLASVQALPEVITFDCTNIGQQNIHLYVIDEAGNWDFCITSVIVQDNNNICKNTIAESMATVSGTIMDWNQKTVENTMVTHTDMSTTLSEGYITNEDGLYNFELAMNKDYLIEPQKNDYPLNGVSTFDLVLISKHILNIKAFDNPYQYLAADANKSGTITAFDMVQIRQLILNIKTAFTNNESWRFVVAGQDFDGGNPLATDFAEVGQINNLAHDRLLDFVAVKVGDVNGNAKTNSLLVAEDRNPANNFEINTTDRYLKAGEQVSVTFATNQIRDIQGYQFTLAFDNLRLEKLHSGLAGVENFGLHKMDEGWITTSWNQSEVGSQQSAVSSQQSTVLFTIDFTAKQNGLLSEQLSIIDKPTTIEAYSTGNNKGEEAGELMDVHLTFTETIVEGRPFELFQNEPNPFDVNTSIGFYLPGDSEIVLTLRNEAGQILKVIKEDKTAGEHRINLENIDLPKGFIYYQLTSKYGAKAKKMLHLD